MFIHFQSFNFKFPTGIIAMSIPNFVDNWVCRKIVIENYKQLTKNEVRFMTCKQKNLRMMKGRNIKMFYNGDYI